MAWNIIKTRLGGNTHRLHDDDEVVARDTRERLDGEQLVGVAHGVDSGEHLQPALVEVVLCRACTFIRQPSNNTHTHTERERERESERARERESESERARARESERERERE